MFTVLLRMVENLHFYECPECGYETFICLDGEQFVCLSCGIKPIQEDLTTCGGPCCNGKYLYRQDGEGAQICSICWEYIKSE